MKDIQFIQEELTFFSHFGFLYLLFNFKLSSHLGKSDGTTLNYISAKTSLNGVIHGRNTAFFYY
jgi:hypothetical protein